MSSVSISSRPLNWSARACNFVRSDPPRTVPTTFQPFFRNSAAIASPRPREAAMSRIVGTLRSKESDGMAIVLLYLHYLLIMATCVDKRQTHGMQTVVAAHARSKLLNALFCLHG